MDRPTVDEIIGWKSEICGDAFIGRSHDIAISLLSQSLSEADGITVLLLQDRVTHERLGALLLSAPASPETVALAMTKARQAHAALPTDLARPILLPIADGKIQGLTYAILPYCTPLSERKSLWWIQRAAIRSPLFAWLRNVTKHTAKVADEAALVGSFVSPLCYAAKLSSLHADIRKSAKYSLTRLESGAWTPKLVLMHGDMWSRNILISPSNGMADYLNWRKNFKIIDWPGSNISGHAFYDLLRLANSMKMSSRELRIEIDAHSRALNCNREDARSYLLAALGYIALNLNHFPAERFVAMAESAFLRLNASIK